MPPKSPRRLPSTTAPAEKPLLSQASNQAAAQSNVRRNLIDRRSLRANR
jgi:hypothetical protein